MLAGDTADLPRFGEVGAWWGSIPQPLPTNPRRQGEAEIEVVGAQGANLVLAGEAKWRREPVGFAVLNHLREVTAQVPGMNQSTQLVLFGRTFDPKLQTAVSAEGVKLITVDDLYA